MRRREFIGFLSTVASLWPLEAWTQPSSGKLWRLAVLYAGSWEDEADRALFDAFREEMRNLGYVEGKNLIIDRRGAAGHYERLSLLLSELIALGPDAIVAIAAPAVAAVQRVTSTIPTVMWGVGDPVAAGFIKSLARPGANITGVANMYQDTIGKVLELLDSIVPAVKRIAVLTSSNLNHPRHYETTEIAAKTLGLATIPISAPASADLEQAFHKINQENCDALFVLADAIRPAIVPLAAKAKIPAFFQFSAFVDLGGLASYGASQMPMGRQTARYVARIFQGSNPGELPVEQPTAFELALNLKTAASLGITIPESIVARADKVIE
jgi:putative tryptophan/tyrosine transport system substrate-binding protein